MSQINSCGESNKRGLYEKQLMQRHTEASPFGSLCEHVRGEIAALAGIFPDVSTSN
jgi:hypothetical protein